MRIVLADVHQHLDLDQRLLVEALLVADDLDRDVRALLVVVRLDDLPERALPEHPHHLVPVAHVIAHHHLIVATLVVKAVLRRAHARAGHRRH
eukprot:5095038-Prymnesium_polylepis.1